MTKNIAIFVDGSGQGETSKHASNVLKLFHDAKSHQADNEQILFYLPGVGTDPCALDEFLGLGFGFGSVDRIVEAYQFLCTNYRNGDHIYLFGFSRGAFAVRSLAGFVRYAGTRYLEAPDQLRVRFEAYTNRLLEVGQEDEALNALILGDRPERPGIPVYFIGVWDTVVALRGNAGDNYLGTEYSFHDLEMPVNVTHVRHALAAHEYRHMFEPVLFNTLPATRSGEPKPRLKQVWFAGDHSDIGGSHSESDLANVTLRWMAQECANPEGSSLIEGQGPPGLKISHSTLATGCYLGAKRIHRMLMFPPYHLRYHLTGRRQTTDEALASMSLHPTLVNRLCDAGSHQEDLKLSWTNGIFQRILTEGLQSTEALGASCDDAIVRFGVFLSLRGERDADQVEDFANSTLRRISRTSAINVTRLLDCWLQHEPSPFCPDEDELSRCLLVALLLRVENFGERLARQVAALRRIRALPQPKPVPERWEAQRLSRDLKVLALAAQLDRVDKCAPNKVSFPDWLSLRLEVALYEGILAANAKPAAQTGTASRQPIFRTSTETKAKKWPKIRFKKRTG